jgi:phosphoglycolate phosphatase-like HAD superfamily hydrolase
LLRVLILDFDGVIIESNQAKTQAFRELFSRFPNHADYMMAYHHDNVSKSRFDKFDHLLARLGRDGDAALRAGLSETFSQLVLRRILDVPFVPGAEAFLKTMARLPMYLASVTPADELGDILEHRNLLHWFQGIYGCPPWTKPEAIVDILSREHAAPADALLIGDSAGDQRAANETGVGFLARDSGLPFDEPLPRQFPDLSRLGAHLESVIDG